MSIEFRFCAAEHHEGERRRDEKRRWLAGESGKVVGTSAGMAMPRKSPLKGSGRGAASPGGKSVGILASCASFGDHAKEGTSLLKKNRHDRGDGRAQKKLGQGEGAQKRVLGRHSQKRGRP